MKKPPKPLRNATFLKAMLAGASIYDAARKGGYKLNSDSIYLRRQVWAEFQTQPPVIQRDILSVLDPEPDSPEAAETPRKRPLRRFPRGSLTCRNRSRSCTKPWTAAPSTPSAS